MQKKLTIRKFNGPNWATDLVRQNPESALALLAATIPLYAHGFIPLRGLGGYKTRPIDHALMRLADRVSGSWFRRNRSPYLSDIFETSQILNRPAGMIAIAANMENYCTAGFTFVDGRPILVRVMDWPIVGAGQLLEAAQVTHGVGRYTHLTWPGFAGVLTVGAKDRFAIAINEAPMRTRIGSGKFLNSWLNRGFTFCNNNPPAHHVVRQICDTAWSYAEAKQMLLKANISTRVTYVITGTKTGEAAIIEADSGRRFERPPHECSTANSWSNRKVQTRATVWKSDERAQLLSDLLESMTAESALDLSWMKYPIANRDSRVVATIDVAADTMVGQGWEMDPDNPGRGTAISAPTTILL